MTLQGATNTAALTLLAATLLVLAQMFSDSGGVTWFVARAVVSVALIAAHVVMFRAFQRERGEGAAREELGWRLAAPAFILVALWVTAL